MPVFVPDYPGGSGGSGYGGGCRCDCAITCLTCHASVGFIIHRYRLYFDPTGLDVYNPANIFVDLDGLEECYNPSIPDITFFDPCSGSKRVLISHGPFANPATGEQFYFPARPGHGSECRFGMTCVEVPGGSHYAYLYFDVSNDNVDIGAQLVLQAGWDGRDDPPNLTPDNYNVFFGEYEISGIIDGQPFPLPGKFSCKVNFSIDVPC